MPRKKKPEPPSEEPSNQPEISQTLQRTDKRDALVPVSGADFLRDAFYRYFEETCGNVSKTCEYIGIDRRTYYNWYNGERDEDIEFRRRVDEIKADERYIDIAEATLLENIRKGDVASTIFTLKTKGKKRGWSERSEEETLALINVARAFDLWLQDNSEVPPPVQVEALKQFARRGNVPEGQLARKVGLRIGE